MDSGKLVVVVSWTDNAVLLCLINSLALCNNVAGAMSHLPILDPEEEEKLAPHELSDVLIKRVFAAKKAKVSVNDQYKVDYQKTLKDVQNGNVEWPVKSEEMMRRRSAFLTGSQHRAERHLGYKFADSVLAPGTMQSQLGGVQEEGLDKIHESEEAVELEKLAASSKERDDGF
jgi:hypothetical protein